MALQVKTFRISDAASEAEVNAFLVNKRVHHWEADYSGDPELGIWHLLVAYEEDHRRNERPMPSSQQRRAPEPKATPVKVDTPPDVPQELLGMYENIRKWRNQVARDEKIKPYVLFNNKQLEDLVKTPPATLDTLKGVVSDMTPELFEKYANQLLGLISAANATA